MTEPCWRRWSRFGLTAFSALLLGCGAAWGIGFAMFHNAAWECGKAPEAADGIVVLTGGADRIETALRLLAEGRGPGLLVSGVARGADLAVLDRRVPLDADQASRVTLGRIAQSTAGNAAEAALWSQAHNLKRLIVVTAGYHMPRALLELHRALPDVQLLPAPVQPAASHGGTRVRALASEYDKLLAVRFGLARLLRNGDAR